LGGATTLNEILEARSSIEPIVARLAALRAEAHELSMISRYFLLARKSSSWSDWEHWDQLFHRAVADASGDGILISTVDQLLRIKMHPRWSVTKSATFDAALVKRYCDEHAGVVSAITNRDPNGAEAAMRRHMLGLSLTIGPVLTLHG
jgi:DNA-binding FadR family transcriptional regulator